jgi:hypothetical protein
LALKSCSEWIEQQTVVHTSDFATATDAALMVVLAVAIPQRNDALRLERRNVIDVTPSDAGETRGAITA